MFQLKYLRFKQKADTRWLTLGQQAKWICDMWPALVAYFRSVGDADLSLSRVFKSEESALQYKTLSVFMNYTLGLLNKFNTATQVTFH